MAIVFIKKYIKYSYIILLLYIGIGSLSMCIAEGKVYTVGVVPQFETRRLYQIWQLILIQLEKDTGLKFKFKGSANITVFEKEFLAGRFDFVYMNPYHLIWSQETQGYRPLVRDISKQLQGILVVRKESEINTVKQLDNKALAFPSPNALGASLLLRAELSNKFNIKIIPRYVNTHDSVYLNVFLKQVAAGGGVQKTLNQQNPKIRNQLRVLYKTKKLASHPFASHSSIPENISNQVKQSFLNFGNSPAGRKLLAEIPIYKIGVATMDDYSVLQNMHLEKYRLEE